MTLEQINELLLEDYREQMANRLWNKFDPRPIHGHDLITITESKTYELRHYINNSVVAGLGNSGYATTNIHAQVKLTKLR